VFRADLSTCAGFARGDEVRAIGWLDAAHPYPRGPVPRRFRAALRKHTRTTVQVVLSGGSHRCNLCSRRRQYWWPRACLYNLIVPAAGRLYVAPELVTHYVAAHGYRPPDEFVAAVLACPPQGSEAYWEQLLALKHCWLRGAEPAAAADRGPASE
jgi:hypothetical protein